MLSLSPVFAALPFICAQPIPEACGELLLDGQGNVAA